MPVLSEDLERVAITLREITDHEVEVVDQSVYVNFGFSEALVIDPHFHPAGMVWSVCAMAWDRTHGVSAEHEVDTVGERRLPRVVQDFLAEQARREAELEAILASIPEE